MICSSNAGCEHFTDLSPPRSLTPPPRADEHHRDTQPLRDDRGGRAEPLRAGYWAEAGPDDRPRGGGRRLGRVDE